jgi:hypothetical protein
MNESDGEMLVADNAETLRAVRLLRDMKDVDIDQSGAWRWQPCSKRSGAADLTPVTGRKCTHVNSAHRARASGAIRTGDPPPDTTSS